MPAPLVPATLAFAPDGTPYSAVFDDVYHSSDGGPAQARHVFLSGNDLPARWRRTERFTILETGFGLGLNFLATWAAWQEDPARSAKLHYVSIDKHPFCAADLARAHATLAGLETQSTALCASWPVLVPGMHRLEFDTGRVVLTLCFGDIAEALRELRFAADAFFLDGFSPAKNPDMWSVRVLKALAKRAAPNATLATYTAASTVRAALTQAGFDVEKRPGFARKRDMLCARYVGEKWRPVSAYPHAPPARGRRAIVIGAGVAGSAVCECLAARGWEVILIDRHAAPAGEASGNHAGVFHPLVTRDDSFMARLSRASFLYSLAHWKSLDGVSWARCGALQMARDAIEDAGQQRAMSELAYPADYACYLDQASAARATGAAVAAGGLWFPQGGWIQPVTLVNSLLARAKVSRHFGQEVERLEHGAAGWSAIANGGRILATAPVAVLANAYDAVRLCPLAGLTLLRVRGQVSYLPEAGFPRTGAVLLRGGFAMPPVSGIVVTGATYDIDEDDPEVRADSHADNLARLARVLPGAGAGTGIDPATLDGRVAFRAVAPDRLPLLGPLPGPDGRYAAFAYGSRGILWCCLMAELLASRIEAEPWPVEGRLAEAVSPERFRRHAARLQVG